MVRFEDGTAIGAPECNFELLGATARGTNAR